MVRAIKLFTMAILGLLLIRLVSAQGTTTTLPIKGSVPVPSECTSVKDKSIAFTGSITLRVHVVKDSSGGLHVQAHAQSSDIQGTGTPTSSTYAGKTVDQLVFNQNGSRLEGTANIHVKLDGSQGAKIFLHVVAHVVVHSDGSVTGEVLHIQLNCH